MPECWNGRQARFRSVCSQGRGSSTLPSGTKCCKINPLTESNGEVAEWSKARGC